MAKQEHIEQLRRLMTDVDEEYPESMASRMSKLGLSPLVAREIIVGMCPRLSAAQIELCEVLEAGELDEAIAGMLGYA